MKLLLMFVAIVFINIFYLYCFRLLMKSLEDKANGYWRSLGSPNSFSASHVSAILSSLYKRKMTIEANMAQIEGVLKSVRFLFPLTFVSTGILLFFLSRIMNQSA